MNRQTFALTVTSTTATCPIGETIGRENAASGAIPVLSCEGPCIRGEIARLAANQLARDPGYRRACHGELLTAPHSTMATWVKSARSVVVVDGCHMRCHARMIEHLVPRSRLRTFDAAGYHRKFSDQFEADSVPEGERKAVAGDVANWVRRKLAQPDDSDSASPSGCCPPPPCCGS